VRVLFIVNNFPAHGNPVDGIFNLRGVQAMRARGHDVRVLRIAPFIPPWLERRQYYRTLAARYYVDGIPVRVLRGLIGPKRWGIGTLALQMSAAMHDELSTYRPDIVHVHGLLPAGVLALCCNVPVVLTAHGSETYALARRRAGLRSLARKVLKRADAVTAVSGFIASHLADFGRPDAPVIYNGADEWTFAPRDRGVARAELDIPQDRPVIAFAGRVTREKGVHELIASLGELQALRPLLLVAGEGDGMSAAKHDAIARALDVRFFGRLDHRALACVLAACDVFVLPSYFEGLPTSICEAMMMGRAVVATSVGGIPEIVREDQTGFVVPPRNSAALLAALRMLLTNVELRERFEKRAHAFAAKHLSWRRHASAYEAIYTDLRLRKRDHGLKATDILGWSGSLG
jgi:teichuronic acid biosynthesis glycosyltransferase TuaC